MGLQPGFLPQPEHCRDQASPLCSFIWSGAVAGHGDRKDRTETGGWGVSGDLMFEEPGDLVPQMSGTLGDRPASFIPP